MLSQPEYFFDGDSANKIPAFAPGSTTATKDYRKRSPRPDSDKKFLLLLNTALRLPRKIHHQSAGHHKHRWRYRDQIFYSIHFDHTEPLDYSSPIATLLWTPSNTNQISQAIAFHTL